jgi:hypothetical protein
MADVGPMEVNKFSGGVTDHIFSSNPSKAQILDNFILLSNETPQTRPGSLVDNTSAADSRIPAGNQRIGTLIDYDNSANLLVQSARKVYYRNPTAYSTIQGPSGNDVFNVGTISNLVSYSTWNKHIFITHDGWPRPMKIFKDAGGTMRVRTAGLPALASIPTVTRGAAGTQSFLYSFHMYVEYQVGNQTFANAGPVTTVELLSAAAPNLSPVNITGIPVLSNGATDNYDTANIKIKIFRTTNGGIDQWLVGEVSNGTTSFLDFTSDLVAVDSSLIYLSDGTLDFDPPPVCKFVHVVNNIGYYGFLKEGAEEFPFDYRASSPLSIDSCPIPFRDTVEDVIVAISSVQSIPIILCRRFIYRVEGSFDQFGRGNMGHVRLSDYAGCVSNQSVVQAENGLFWAGNDGFYYSDGYQVMKISDGNNENYKKMLAASNNPARIYGKFDELNRRIYWGVQFDSSSFDNDAIFALDLRYGIRSDSTFTTWSGGVSFRPTALEFHKGKLYRADSRGYVMYHEYGLTTDPLVDTTKTPTDWNLQPIIHHYRSVAFDFGSNFMRKIATKILFTARNKTNISIQINAINDDGKLTRPLKEIRWRRNFIWGDQEFVWGDIGCIWHSEGLIEQWRRMPARGLRFSYLQIDITNSFTAITNSDTIGKATFNPSTNQAVLDTSATSSWPIDCVGYFITTEEDGYARQFEIAARTNDTITFVTSIIPIPVGSLKWVLRGVRKSEILNLLSYNIHWANLSKTQGAFETGQDGGNS